jgi:hypothetical protein
LPTGPVAVKLAPVDIRGDGPEVVVTVGAAGEPGVPERDRFVAPMGVRTRLERPVFIAASGAVCGAAGGGG